MIRKPAVTECHASCKTCTGATNQDCDECKEGWEEDEQEACVGNKSPCDATEKVTAKIYK